jgi:hypothetical protein
MQKLLITALLASVAVVVPVTAEAKTAPATVEAPQVRVQIGRNNRRYNRRVRTRTYTRIVGFGRNRFRETVRVTYLPNGRTITQVIRRQRLSWYRG